MKKLIKPACIGFYLLMFITFFFIGLYYAGMIDAGKNQGLAAGAIVLGWGVKFGGIAFIFSFFIAYYLQLKKLVKINWGLLAFCLITLGYTYFQFQQRNSQQNDKQEIKEQTPETPTSPLESNGLLPKSIPIHYIEDTVEFQEKVDKEMGMGYFSPNVYQHSALYFYGNPNLEKSMLEHLPTDSMTFKRNKYNQFEIATAPPWLIPEISKLDYDMLYFRIKSVTEEFAEIIVNTNSNQTSFIDRRSGDIVYWPDFLLGVNSVEFEPGSTEEVQVRPFKESGVNQVPHQFMRPIRIRGEWMEVLLLNNDFRKVGKGWIQWKRDRKLLVRTNLLS